MPTHKTKRCIVKGCPSRIAGRDRMCPDCWEALPEEMRERIRHASHALGLAFAEAKAVLAGTQDTAAEEPVGTATGA